MSDPRPETQGETTDRRWIDEFKAREVRSLPRAQVIIVWDGTQLIIEGAGANGQRQKIEGTTFDDLPSEVQAALIEQLDRQKAIKPVPAPKTEYTDPQVERERAAAEAGKRRLQERQTWINGLPEPKRTLEQNKFNDQLRRAKEEHDARARAIYKNIINDHGDINLANRVISDPNRRPRTRVVVVTNQGQKLVSPRTGKTTDQTKTTSRFRGAKGGRVIKINDL